jgi:hypothetical protein
MLMVFECRVAVSQFGPAVAMLKLMDAVPNDTVTWWHAGYTLLSVTVSYFEMIEKILNARASNWRSTDDSGFRDVYPETALIRTRGRFSYAA